MCQRMNNFSNLFPFELFTKQSNKPLLFRQLYVRGIHAVLSSPTFPSLTVSLSPPVPKMSLLGILSLGSF